MKNIAFLVFAVGALPLSSFADSIGVLSCFDQAQKLSIEVSYLPEPGQFVPMEALIVQGEDGGPIGTPDAMYNNYDKIRLVRKMKGEKVYAGPNFRLTVKGVQGRIEATLEDGSKIDTSLPCR